MQERRKHKRYTVAYPIEFDRLKVSSGLMLVDVSNGGVAFNATEELKPDDMVSVKLFMKNRMFTLPAVVVRINKQRQDLYNVGARFIETPREFVELLEKEIKEITQHHRESNLYQRRDLTFEKASKEYLER